MLCVFCIFLRVVVSTSTIDWSLYCVFELDIIISSIIATNCGSIPLFCLIGNVAYLGITPEKINTDIISQSLGGQHW